MSLRFYTNVLSQASRRIGAGIFTAGMMLIGFGFMIYILPKFFATLAAIIFCVTGTTCLITAIKIFLTAGRIDKDVSGQPQDYRKNVQIRTREHHDL